MIRRLVLPEGLLGADEITVAGPPLHYLSRVLRLRPGEEVELVDGTGRRILGRLERISKNEALVSMVAELPEDPAPARPLHLVYGLSRGRRTDMVLQKATELGVDAVALALCERSVKRPGQEPDKLARWQEIVAQAARQCGRARFPVVHPVLNLEDALASVPPGGTRLLAHPGGISLGQAGAEATAATGHLAVAVGPEGGFTEEEARSAEERGFVAVSLGPNILRTETAAVALLTLAGFFMGKMTVPAGGEKGDL